jgi:hypothetical protein
MDEQDLRALGGLPELSYLCLRKNSAATMTLVFPDGCFQRLRT